MAHISKPIQRRNVHELPGALFSNGTHHHATRVDEPHDRNVPVGSDAQQRARLFSLQDPASAVSVVLRAVTARAYAWPPHMREDYLAGRLSTTLAVPELARETGLEQAAVWDALAMLVDRGLLGGEIKRDGKHVECWIHGRAEVQDA